MEDKHSVFVIPSSGEEPMARVMPYGWPSGPRGGLPAACLDGDSDLGSFVAERDAIGFEKKDLAFVFGDAAAGMAVIGERWFGCRS
jgi:hypothetical protein